MEELQAVKNVIQVILKAKKALKMYPRNNPIYINNLKDLSDGFTDFFQCNDTLRLSIGKNDIYYDGEMVYNNPEKHDNLAVLFFRDGLSELTFRKGLTVEEVEEFMRIISLDFDHEAIDDDIVTLLWGMDFRHIEYVVDEAFLADEEDYESKTTHGMQRKEDEPNDPCIFHDTLNIEEEIKDPAIFTVTEEDFAHLSHELDRQAEDKTIKFFSVLFEVLSSLERNDEYQDITSHFMKTISFSIKNGNLNAVTEVQEKLAQMIDEKNMDGKIRNCAEKLRSYMGGYSVITLVGEILDSNQAIEDDIIRKFIKYLDTNAIMPFVQILGELKTIRARRIIIDALVNLVGENPVVLYEHLNDARWYVVRNIVHILSKIGNVKAVNHLLKTLRHEDIRVKKEVIRALGQFGGEKALTALKECCRGKDPKVRKYALGALGNIGSQAAKKIIMEQISDQSFRDNSFEYKKEYFEVLARWNDSEVYDFLVNIMNKKSFFGKKKNDEMKACAAHCLGLIGKTEALPILDAYKAAPDRLLRESSDAARKNIENGT